MASVKSLLPWHSAPVFLPVMHSVHSVSPWQPVNSAQQDPSKHVWQAGSAVNPHLALPPPPHSALHLPLRQPMASA
jgi:hypothetical protein